MANITVGTQLTTALNTILTGDDIEPGTDPSYQLCKTLYAYHPIGAKLVDNPITMAQSQEREISIPLSPEEEVRDAFLREWAAINADTYIAQTYSLCRTYGISALALLDEKVASDQPIDFDKLASARIGFNCFDPLNVAGSLVLNQDPNSINFMKTTSIVVQGKAYHPSRTVVIMNERPLYIEYTTSSFGYVGRSVYQRCLFPMKSFLRTMICDDMIATKSGLIVAKMASVGSVVDNIMQTMFAWKRSILQQAQTWNVISISTEEAIETLNMQNIDGAYGMARKNILENIAAANNMPAKLLNQETFAEGFGEGTEDAKYIAQYIERLRIQMLPLYDFMDRIVQHRAWNAEFYKTIQAKYPEAYGKMQYNTALKQWQNSFRAVWPSLIREPDSEKIKVDDVKLKAIIAIVEVFMPALDPANRARIIQWAQDNINDMKLLFSSVFQLDMDELEKFQPQEPPGEGSEEGEEEPKEPKPFAATDSWRKRPGAAALAQRLRDAESRLDDMGAVVELVKRRAGVA